MPADRPDADIQRLDQNARRSRAVVAGGLVYLAGQVADDGSLDVEGQARQALGKVDALLAQAGTDRSHLITAQIWLATMTDFDAFNKVWDDWVVPGHTPTRCCGQVALADPRWRVEVVVSAKLA